MMQTFLVDRTRRLRMTFRGDKAKESLGGLVSNDVIALTKGAGQRAVALTAKGRVIALLRIFDRGDDLLVDTEPETAEAFFAVIRKYVNPRAAQYAVISDDTACLGIHGADAAALVHKRVGVDVATLEALPPHGIVRSPDGAYDVIRSQELSVPGFDVIGARTNVAMIAAGIESPACPFVDESVTEPLRIELGLPRFGLEMDEDTIPQEANLDVLGAISFNKGCYTGQEVVARIHFRGHVNKHLRWLKSVEPLTRGATLLDADGKDVGQVRSAAVHPLRGPLAIGMVRREVIPGSSVRVQLAGGEVFARIEEIK